MIEYTYYIADLIDWFHNDRALFNESIETMKREISKGNTIIIEEVFDNASNDIVLRTNTSARLTDWLQENFKV